MTYIEQRKQFFRDLTPAELQTEIDAMRFLYRKGITLARIRTLNVLEIKGNYLTSIHSTKHFTFKRMIPLSNTPLEKQLQALPNLKSSFRVFPKQVWTKRKIQNRFVPTWTEAELRTFLNLKPKREQRILEKDKSKVLVTIPF